MPIKTLKDWFTAELVSRKRYALQQLLHRLMAEQKVDYRTLNLPELNLRHPDNRGLVDYSESDPENMEEYEEEEEEDEEDESDIIRHHYAQMMDNIDGELEEEEELMEEIEDEEDEEEMEEDEDVHLANYEEEVYREEGLYNSDNETNIESDECVSGRFIDAGEYSDGSINKLRQCKELDDDIAMPKNDCASNLKSFRIPRLNRGNKRVLSGRHEFSDDNIGQRNSD